jgi:hypothetical protein
VTRLAALVLLAATAAGGSGVPVATSRPAVNGTLQQGSRLTANPGSWSASGPVGFAYQWSRCDAAGGHCSSIHGATGPTYTQVRADVGHTLAVTVAAHAAGGTAVAYAPLAGLVAPKAAAFAATAQPALAGDAFVGSTLSVSAVRWTAIAPIATYRWLRCNQNGRLCTGIRGARSVSYTLTAADAGHVVAALVTASRQSVLSTSSAVVRDAPGPLPLSRPGISGTFRVGEKLSGDTGVWSGGGTISYAYQWYRCNLRGAKCSTLRGATRSTYTAVAADAGHTLALSVHAADSTGTATAYSSLVGLVAPAAGPLAARAQPLLDGVPAAGRELRVGEPVLTGKAASTAYSWLRCTVAVRSCAAIAGADKAAYTVTTADSGHALVAAVATTAAGERLVTLSAAATVG